MGAGGQPARGRPGPAALAVLLVAADAAARPPVRPTPEDDACSGAFACAFATLDEAAGWLALVLAGGIVLAAVGGAVVAAWERRAARREVARLAAGGRPSRGAPAGRVVAGPVHEDGVWLRIVEMRDGHRRVEVLGARGWEPTERDPGLCLAMPFGMRPPGPGPVARGRRLP
jgi:hypothetical protein